MPTAAPGDTVKVHYTAALADGTAVAAATEQTVTPDANPRRAGKDLLFDPHRIAIREGPSCRDPGHGPCGCGRAHD
jgi:FKBP-type peptidyl-prolyl cis-trans isomerase 2